MTVNSSSSSSYALGLFFIFLVSVIWSAASVLVQYLYEDQSFDSPFLLTYIGTSLFTILLPLEWLLQYFAKNKQPSYHQVTTTSTNTTTSADGSIAAAEAATPSTGDYESISDHDNNRAVNTDSNNDNSEDATKQYWTIQDHFYAACKIAPVWFLANYSYNASLKFTSITSSTVLSCTGSLFTFLFALLLRDEHFSCFKLVGVLLGMTGSILTGLQDVHETNAPSDTDNDDDDNMSLWGDALGLLGAVGYGAYATMVRVLCPRDESLMSMQLFLGFVGLFNMVTLSPVLLVTSLSANSSGQSLTWLVFGCLIVKGLTDNVLSDYLWARSVVLTSATVASVGLGLTIPLAFLSDLLFRGRSNVFSLGSVMGALSVLVGFVLVNLGQQHELQQEAAIEEIQQQQHEEELRQQEPRNGVVGEAASQQQQLAPSIDRLHMSMEYTDAPPPSGAQGEVV